MRKRRFLALLGILAFATFFIRHSKAEAINYADFKPGRIIDDVVFTNKSSMTVIQIQAFLNSKVPVCETRKQASFTGGSGTIHYAPFTCLKDYQENITSGVNNYGKYASDNVTPLPVTGGVTAAQIIWQVAQDYNINPQVLLVTLEKEQGLITDTWPILPQFTKATGYRCPDSALGVDVDANRNGCYDSSEGFYKQVSGTGWQLRNDFNGIGTPGFWSPFIKGINNILYNPDPSCGAKTVNIETQATAILYKYTPYTPNDAAIIAAPGVTVNCGAYGNRNFWRLFNDWFGSTYGPQFKSQYYRQSSFPDMIQGQQTSVFFDYKNIGSVAWRDENATGGTYHAVRMATGNPINRKSIFSYGWTQINRPIGIFSKVYEADGVTLSADQHIVYPGQIGRFEFTVGANQNTPPGTYREWFQPVLEGSTMWNLGGEVWMDFTVRPSVSKATYRTQSPHRTIPKNEQQTSYFEYLNSGTAPWYDSISNKNFFAPIHLATTLPINRASQFSKYWPLPSRPNLIFSKVYEADGVTLSADQHIVYPGQIGRFEFTVGANQNTPPGTYREWFQPVLEGSTMWNLGGLAWTELSTSDEVYTAQFHSQSAYPTISQGQGSVSYIQYSNTGNIPWRDDMTAGVAYKPVHLATSKEINRSSIFGSSWGVLKNRPSLTFSKVYEADGTTLATDQHIVYPGQIGRFEFMFQAPNGTATSSYTEWFELVREGSSDWKISGSQAWLLVTVTL